MQMRNICHVVLCNVVYIFVPAAVPWQDTNAWYHMAITCDIMPFALPHGRFLGKQGAAISQFVCAIMALSVLILATLTEAPRLI